MRSKNNHDVKLNLFVINSVGSETNHSQGDDNCEFHMPSASSDQATDWPTGVLFLAWQDFSLCHNVQTGSGAHPTSY
jgi:hypothetical protein